MNNQSENLKSFNTKEIRILFGLLIFNGIIGLAYGFVTDTLWSIIVGSIVGGIAIFMLFSLLIRRTNYKSKEETEKIESLAIQESTPQPTRDTQQEFITQLETIEQPVSIAQPEKITPQVSSFLFDDTSDELVEEETSQVERDLENMFPEIAKQLDTTQANDTRIDSSIDIEFEDKEDTQEIPISSPEMITDIIDGRLVRVKREKIKLPTGEIKWKCIIPGTERVWYEDIVP